MKPSTRVGFPRALLSSRYCLWREFLLQLGFQVIESPKTTTSTMKKGISLTVDDTCMPVKAFVGHVDELLRESVDYIFIPRVIALKKNGRFYYACPKMIGLPDVIKAIFRLDENGSSKILEMEIDEKKQRMERTMLRFGRNTLGVGKGNAKNALDVALRKQREYEQMLANIEEGVDKRLKVAVVGHPYLIFDDYLSLGLLRKLKDMDVQVLTQFNVREAEIERGIGEFSWISWGFEREILGSISYFAEAAVVDGIIYFTSFGCGPFAVISELVIRSIKKKSNIPILFLMIDELTGEGGFLTRIESFVDMIKARK